MMARGKLISAEDLFLSMRDDPEINAKHFARIREHIDHAPDAMKRGRWIPHNKGQNNWVECSRCNTAGSPFWKCCPVCEARMDGDEDAK